MNYSSIFKFTEHIIHTQLIYIKKTTVFFHNKEIPILILFYTHNMITKELREYYYNINIIYPLNFCYTGRPIVFEFTTSKMNEPNV